LEAKVKPQRQTKFGGADHPDHEKGDCFAACVATILEVDLASLPNFCARPPNVWFEEMQAYLEKRFGLMLIGATPETAMYLPDEHLFIASGPGPRGHRHSVVFNSLGLVWDPHPSDAGLLEVTDREFFVVAKFGTREQAMRHV
jgi:hypothetical protein